MAVSTNWVHRCVRCWYRAIPSDDCQGSGATALETFSSLSGVDEYTTAFHHDGTVPHGGAASEVEDVEVVVPLQNDNRCAVVRCHMNHCAPGSDKLRSYLERIFHSIPPAMCLHRMQT